MNKYIIGRSNLAATIYVPYDCGNNCPFCTSKEMYRELEPNLELLWKNINLLNKTRKIKDIVLTGGEPFANLEILQKILDKVDYNSKNIFINTSLPFKTDEDRKKIHDFLKKNKRRITCLNVSRHLSTRTINDDNDRFINNLEVPYRINCVLFNIDYNSIELKDKMINFIKRFPKAKKICFRADYRQITMSNLKTLDHPFIQFAINELNAQYQGSGGCQVCNDDSFIWVDSTTSKKYNFSLHRGLEFSSIRIGNTIIINDIIMMPDSHMYYDWDKKRPEAPERMFDVLKAFGYAYNHYSFESGCGFGYAHAHSLISGCGFTGC